MAVTLKLEPDTEQLLRRRAECAGQTLETYLQQLADFDARNGTPVPAQKPTIDDILAPVRQGFTESGITDSELDGLFEEAINDSRRERRRENGHA